MPHGHAAVADRLAVDRDAEGRARLVHPAIATADRAAVVIERREPVLERLIHLRRQFRHPILLHQGKDARLDRRERRMEAQHHAHLALHLLFPIGIDHHRERHPVGARGGLDDVGDVALVRGLIEILQLLSRILLVAAQVEIGAIVDPLDLLPAKGELVLNIEGVLGVMGQLVGAVPMEAELRGREAEPLAPFHAPAAPALEPFFVGSRLDEELHFHLLELASAKDEVPRGDLVPERLADLGDPEGNFLARRIEHVEVVDVDALRRLGAEIDDRSLLFHRTHEGLEHQVEQAGLGQRALAAADRTLRIRLARRPLDPGIVGAKAVLAMSAINQRIGEAGDVSRRLPYLRMHEDRGVEPLDVIAGVNHGVPPAVLDVLLELDAEGAVVPDRTQAAVDLGRLEDEAAPLGERHELVHEGGVGHQIRCE